MRAVADATLSGVSEEAAQTFVKLSESQHLLHVSCYRCRDDMHEEKVRETERLHERARKCA